MKRQVLIALQVAVTAALLGWIFRDSAFRREVAGLFLRAHRGWLAAAFVTSGFGVALSFLRWGIFLRVVGIRLSAWDVTRIASVGLFFNSFLPGVVGGDAVKAGWLAARGHSARDALLSVVMDRMSGIGALVLCSLAFVLPQTGWLARSRVMAALTPMVFLYLGAVVCILACSFLLAAHGLVGRLPARFPARAALQDFAATYRLFLSAWQSTLLASGLSVLMLLCYFFTFFFAALAMGEMIPVFHFLALMPAVDIIAALPVSLGGFGVREAAFVGALGELCGTRADVAVAISFAGAIVALLWGCLGLLMLPSYRRDVR